MTFDGLDVAVNNPFGVKCGEAEGDLANEGQGSGSELSSA
jgi:hypothetical protein